MVSVINQGWLGRKFNSPDTKGLESAEIIV